MVKKTITKKDNKKQHVIQIILDDENEKLSINTTDVKNNDDAVSLLKMMITTLSSMCVSFDADEEQVLNALDSGIHEAQKDFKKAHDKKKTVKKHKKSTTKKVDKSKRD